MKGLERLGLVTLLRKHPKELKELFVYSPKALDAETFVTLMEVPSIPEADICQVQAYKWFLEYIKERQSRKYNVIEHY